MKQAGAEDPHDHGHDHPHPHAHPAGSAVKEVLGAVFRPHSHDHAQRVDRTMEQHDEGMRALKISLVGLGITALLQLAVVLFSGSVALLADTVHNFADALTALPLAIAFRMGRRQPTRRYNYGYGRAEDLAGIFIVVTIAFSAVFAGWEAIRRLLAPQAVRGIGWVALAGLVGFAGNAWVAAYRIRAGNRIGSAALVADGHHARSDALTSLAVLFGAAGVAAGFPMADPLIGLLITVAIVFVLKDAARDIYRRLMDSVDPALVDSVEAVLSEVPGVLEVSGVRVRWIGHQLRAEANVVSDRTLTLAQAHDIAVEGHHRLLHRIPRLSEAIIHSDPSPLDGRSPHEALEHHFPASPADPPPAPSGEVGDS
ncbi:MAG: cation diffusion facilitator family transporter [Actinomycetota bacterium]